MSSWEKKEIAMRNFLEAEEFIIITSDKYSQVDTIFYGDTDRLVMLATLATLRIENEIRKQYGE